MSMNPGGSDTRLSLDLDMGTLSILLTSSSIILDTD